MKKKRAVEVCWLAGFIYFCGRVNDPITALHSVDVPGLLMTIVGFVADMPAFVTFCVCVVAIPLRRARE